jgi:hypothetical protein
MKTASTQKVHKASRITESPTITLSVSVSPDSTIQDDVMTQQEDECSTVKKRSVTTPVTTTSHNYIYMLSTLQATDSSLPTLNNKVFFFDVERDLQRKSKANDHAGNVDDSGSDSNVPTRTTPTRGTLVLSTDATPDSYSLPHSQTSMKFPQPSMKFPTALGSDDDDDDDDVIEWMDVASLGDGIIGCVSVISFIILCIYMIIKKCRRGGVGRRRGGVGRRRVNLHPQLRFFCQYGRNCLFI